MAPGPMPDDACEPLREDAWTYLAVVVERQQTIRLFVSGEPANDVAATTVAQRAGAVRIEVSGPLALGIPIDGLTPDPQGGRRGNRVELHYDQLVLPDATEPLAGHCLGHSSLLNLSRERLAETAVQERGPGSAHQAGPIVAGVVGSDKVLDDGTTNNRVRVRIRLGPVAVVDGVDGRNSFAKAQFGLKGKRLAITATQVHGGQSLLTVGSSDLQINDQGNPIRFSSK